MIRSASTQAMEATEDGEKGKTDTSKWMDVSNFRNGVGCLL